MNKNKFLLLFSGLILILGCQNTNGIFESMSYDPVLEPKFNSDKKTVCLDIKKIVNTEDVWMEGYNSFVVDSLTSLNVQLINPIDFSKNEDSIFATQQKVAKALKKMLVNPQQFKEYNIIFIKRDTVKKNFTIVTSEVALSSYTFKGADL